MLRIGFIALIVLFISSFGYSQTQPINTEAIFAQAPPTQAAPGTYEFLRSKIEETFTDEYFDQLLYEIEARRDDYEVVYYAVTDLTVVKIIPRSELPE